jgi:hypothetical protein
MSPSERAAILYSFIRVVVAIRPFNIKEKGYFSIRL